MFFVTFLRVLNVAIITALYLLLKGMRFYVLLLIPRMFMLKKEGKGKYKKGV